jgi:SAM-dependent methyltransferase
VKCYLCGGDLSEVVAKAEEIRFGCFASKKEFTRCASCGLIQLSPPWSGRELNELYRGYWKQADFKGQKRKAKVSTYLEQIIRPGDTALEIGCGHGDNVRNLRKKGLRVIGIDKDPAVCDGKIIVNADVTEVRLKKRPDVIYAIHLLEHILDPKWLLRWISDNLAEGGRFAIEVPNADDPLRVLYKNKGFHKFCWYPYHLFYFTKGTMERLMAETPGIRAEVRVVQEYGILNHLRWGITGKPGNALPTIPILDAIYKFVLTRILGVGDTLVVIGSKA